MKIKFFNFQIEYRKQGKQTAKDMKGFIQCLNETPQVLHAKKVRNLE